LRESRDCSSFKASYGEGVVAYPEPLAILQRRINSEDRAASAFPGGVNKMRFKIDFYISLIRELSIATHICKLIVYKKG